nr:MAG TPA: hypothetical protein [Caudoviricetes sp.]
MRLFMLHLPNSCHVRINEVIFLEEINDEIEQFNIAVFSVFIIEVELSYTGVRIVRICAMHIADVDCVTKELLRNVHEHLIFFEAHFVSEGIKIVTVGIGRKDIKSGFFIGWIICIVSNTDRCADSFAARFLVEIILSEIFQRNIEIKSAFASDVIITDEFVIDHIIKQDAVPIVGDFFDRLSGFVIVVLTNSEHDRLWFDKTEPALGEIFRFGNNDSCLMNSVLPERHFKFCFRVSRPPRFPYATQTGSRLTRPNHVFQRIPLLRTRKQNRT